MEIHAIIPARCGSKSIPNKNIYLINEKPMFLHSVEQAQQSKYINKIFVSSDSQEYLDLIQNKSVVSLLRPNVISDDLSTDLEFMKHYLENTSVKPKLIVHLRPTYPSRLVMDIDYAIEKFLDKYDKYDSLRSVSIVEKSPIKMYWEKNGLLIPIIPDINGIVEPYNMPRQLLPQAYIHNGCIDIIKPDIILNGSMSGNKIMPFFMYENNDIDTLKDIK